MARMLVVLALLAAGAALSAAVLAHGSEAAASAAVPIQRTFVSTSGSDTNPCTRAEPCRNFQAALPNTLAGGEIVALDSGGYGPLTIDKAVSVVGSPGAHVAVSVFSGTGISVNAGVADTVVLRNLHLTGLGGSTGISYTTGGRLHLERVTAAGFTGGAGVLATAAEGKLLVRDSTFRGNQDGLLVDVVGDIKVQIERSSADQNSAHGFGFFGSAQFDGARGSIVESSASGNLWGFFADGGGSILAIADSTAEDNSGGGVGATEFARVSLTRMVLSSNNGGARTFGSSPTISIGGSLVVSNSAGLWNQGGTIETFQDNQLRANTFNTEGTVTAVTKG